MQTAIIKMKHIHPIKAHIDDSESSRIPQAESEQQANKRNASLNSEIPLLFS
jgi:hypothetical protein